MGLLSTEFKLCTPTWKNQVYCLAGAVVVVRGIEFVLSNAIHWYAKSSALFHSYNQRTLKEMLLGKYEWQHKIDIKTLISQAFDDYAEKQRALAIINKEPHARPSKGDRVVALSTAAFHSDEFRDYIGTVGRVIQDIVVDDPWGANPGKVDFFVRFADGKGAWYRKADVKLSWSLYAWTDSGVDELKQDAEFTHFGSPEAGSGLTAAQEARMKFNVALWVERGWLDTHKAAALMGFAEWEEQTTKAVGATDNLTCTTQLREKIQWHEGNALAEYRSDPVRRKLYDDFAGHLGPQFWSIEVFVGLQHGIAGFLGFAGALQSRPELVRWGILVESAREVPDTFMALAMIVLAPPHTFLGFVKRFKQMSTDLMHHSLAGGMGILANMNLTAENEDAKLLGELCCSMAGTAGLTTMLGTFKSVLDLKNLRKIDYFGIPVVLLNAAVIVSQIPEWVWLVPRLDRTVASMGSPALLWSARAALLGVSIFSIGIIEIIKGSARSVPKIFALRRKVAEGSVEDEDVHEVHKVSHSMLAGLTNPIMFVIKGGFINWPCLNGFA